MHHGAEPQACEQQAREQEVLMDDGLGQQARHQAAWILEGVEKQASGQ